MCAMLSRGLAFYYSIMTDWLGDLFEEVEASAQDRRTRCDLAVLDLRLRLNCKFPTICRWNYNNLSLRR